MAADGCEDGACCANTRFPVVAPAMFQSPLCGLGPAFACALTIFAGVTMVSNIRYYSFKDVNLKKSVPFFVIAAIALGFALVAYSPEIALFGFFVLYGLSGYVQAAISLLKRKAP